MTNTQREVMQQALDALREIAWSNDSKWQSDRAQSITEPLRAALAEPVVEPVIDDSTVLAACQKLAPTLFTRGLKPLETDGANWRAMMQEVETTVRNVLSFVNAPQPPAEVNQ